MTDLQSRVEVLRPKAGDTIVAHIDVNRLTAEQREQIRHAFRRHLPSLVSVIVLDSSVSLTHIAVDDEAAPQSKPVDASVHFDAWMRERTERAHREFMERTSRRLPCDATTADITRYMGGRS
jgi:hypothetical protein